MAPGIELPEEVRIFLLECVENMDKVEACLLALESTPHDKELVNRAFRALHTTKGNSGFLAFARLESICHKGEHVLDRVRNAQIQLNSEIVSVLLEVVDAARNILSDIEANGKERERDCAPLIEKLSRFL